MVEGGIDIAGLAAAVAARGVVARVVIAGVKGSTPRGTGTAMLVWAEGQSGTIGGGSLEFQATRLARSLLAAEGRWARQVLTIPLGPALGQCCGGQVTLLIERFGAEEANLLAALPLGERTLLRPTASGVPPSSRAQLEGARLEGDTMIEPFAPARLPLWLYGAGHVGRAVVRVAEGLPLALTWIDTQAERFPDPLQSHVTPLVAAEPGRAVRHAPDAAVHLVMTYSHALDLDICHAVLSRPFGHLGLIGSATKRARFRSRLRALGHSDAALARLVCPIGDPALGKEPAAIALGALAEVLRLGRAPVAVERSA